MYQVRWVWARVRSAHTVNSSNVHRHLAGVVRASVGRSLEGCRYCKSHGRSQEDGVKSRVRTGSELGMPASQMKLGQLCHLMSQLTGQEQGSRPLAQGDWFPQTCKQMLSSLPPVPQGTEARKRCVWREGLCGEEAIPSQESPAPSSLKSRCKIPQARRCCLELWKDHRSKESWGLCQTPSLLLRLRLGRRGEQ